MPLFHIVILALIQGITEFLPISSSGHLVLLHELMDQGLHSSLLQRDNLSMDIAVHVGTLIAVLIYFRNDIFMILASLKTKDSDRSLLTYIIIGSLPVILAGYIFHVISPNGFRSLEVTAWCTLLFGILLWFSDQNEGTERTLKTMQIKDAFLIGMSQALALIPGTSRSGITMTAGRFLGFSREDSARFSLLLSIVAISGAGSLGVFDLIESGNLELGLDVILAVFLSAISGYIAISLMINWLKKSSFLPFVLYRILLGLALLWIIYL